VQSARIGKISRAGFGRKLERREEKVVNDREGFDASAGGGAYVGAEASSGAT